ncbi:uncharacterized protein TrAtP1_005780 [Trichoderma atroviride]|uniref:uncharacterized protein n=1 Tax=Hypocrea atroviridis TaxID=63577 RepID=UPI0033239B41|nr:hypothetical protein TrAtP1_005780 [Trichoderma atroviride]
MNTHTHMHARTYKYTHTKKKKKTPRAPSLRIFHSLLFFSSSKSGPQRDGHFSNGLTDRTMPPFGTIRYGSIRKVPDTSSGDAIDFSSPNVPSYTSPAPANSIINFIAQSPSRDPTIWAPSPDRHSHKEKDRRLPLPPTL